MTPNILKTLTLVDCTAEAASAALDRANVERAKAEKRRADAQTQLAAGIATLTAGARRSLRDEIEDADIDLEQLATIIRDIEQKLAAALIAEKRGAVSKRQADLVRRRDHHLAEFPARYAALKAQMLELIDEGRVIVGDMSKHNDQVLQSFPELVLGGVEQVAEPICETRFWKTADEKRQEAQMIAALNARNARIADEARQQRVDDLERMRIEYSQREQQDDGGVGIFVNGVRQMHAAPY
jgi:hypothetical protein